MKKSYLSLLFLSTICFTGQVFAAPETKVQAPASKTTSSFTSAQVGEIEKTVGEYITKNPQVVMNAIQLGMEMQQKEVVTKMEKAVTDNKKKIFNDPTSPVIGNPKGSQSLVVFLDPYCGYCKKFHGELLTLLTTNKDVKVIVKELPIMGPDSIMTIKALLAAKNQGKYEKLQTAIYSSDKHLTKKQLMKTAKSLGIDPKKLETDMNNKSVQTEIDQTLELAKLIGINGTPTLIIGEKTVVPGFLTADELNQKLKESRSSVKKTSGK